MNLSPDFLLMPLPCGCIVDAATLKEHCDSYRTAETEAYIECYWCKAVILGYAARAWYLGAEPLKLDQAPRLLCQHSGVLLEVVGVCGCLQPIVRKRGQKEVVHAPPVAELEWLHN